MNGNSAAVVGGQASEGSRAANDRGFTLVENLMAIVLTGIIASSLFFAVWTLVRVAAVNEDQAQVEAVARGAIDALKATDYQPCPGADGYDAVAQQGAAVLGWPASTVDVINVSYWDPFSMSWSASNPFGPAECTGAVFLSTARTMQLLEVRATSPDGDYTRTLETVVTDLRDQVVGGA